MCNCCNCPTPIIIDGIGTVTPGNDGSVIFLTLLNETPEVSDLFVTRFIVDLSDSQLTGAEAVKFQIGENTYDVTLWNGTFLQVGRLRRRQLIYLIFEYDSNGGHFKVLNAVGGLLLRIPAATGG